MMHDATTMLPAWILPLAVGLAACGGKPQEPRIEVGDRAPTKGCVAVNAKGQDVALANYVGKQPLILLTYRAHW
ncbi:MAG: hypothetical protein ACODAJ_13635 [Planctomycetota bacterium]